MPGSVGFATLARMRFGAILLAALLWGNVASAEGAGAPADCLSPGDMREAVSAKEVIPPAAAIKAARQAVPRADVVRASLCRRDDRLVYIIVALGRDGRFTEVRIDASSGKVANVH